MDNNLIREDIREYRRWYDEALEMKGIPCKYQYPNRVDPNTQGEAVVDIYSEMIDTFVFFDGNPKVKTYKRLGWFVANDQDLPFLIHCSFNLPHLQKDCLFRIAGQYTEVPDKVFRVTEITYDIQAPDHMIAQVVPVYNEDKPVGNTQKEIAKKFNKSNTFLQQPVDYRGHYYNPDQTEGG